MLRKCKYCDAPVAPGAKYCPHCGGAAPTHSWLQDAAGALLFGNTVRCRSCRAKVHHSASYCPRCGAPHPATFSWLRLLDPQQALMLLWRLFVILVMLMVLMRVIAGI